MGDAQHLLAPAHLGQLLRHLLGRPAGDAGIHLVEHQGGHGLLLRQHVFQRQHDAGQLAAGGDLGDGPQVLPYVGGHEESNGVAAVGAGLLLREVDGKADLVHVQVPQLPLDALLQRKGGRLPGLGQRSAGVLHSPADLPKLFFQPGQGVIGGLHGVQLRPALVQVVQHILHGGAVLLFQPVQLVRPALHRVQLRRGKVELRPLVPDDLGKVIGFTPQHFQAFMQFSQLVAQSADAGDSLLRVPNGRQSAAGILAVRPFRLQVRAVNQGVAVEQRIVVSQPSVAMRA